MNGWHKAELIALQKPVSTRSGNNHGNFEKSNT